MKHISGTGRLTDLIRCIFTNLNINCKSAVIGRVYRTSQGCFFKKPPEDKPPTVAKGKGSMRR